MTRENSSKEKLLQTAVDLIWESSYGSVSVDDICTKAGVNKGSFYYAFKSKSDLAVAAFERHWEMKRPLLDQVFSPQLSPLARLDGYLEAIMAGQKEKYASFGKMLGCPFCSIGSELSTQDENIRKKAEQITARMVKYMESLVRDLAAEGRIECQNPHELAREVMMYIGGLLLQAKIENNVGLVDRLPHGVKRLLDIRQPAAA